MAARFPVKPKEDDIESFTQFVHLLSKLYPCGQCAREFQHILKINPPSLKSRSDASQWMCEVNF